MDDLDHSIQKTLEDPEFKKEWEATETAHRIRKMVIAARGESGMTQKELSEKIGVRKSNISRIERGDCIPTVATLEAIAKGVGKKLVVEFA